jgi:hypothetical protein
MSALSVKQRAFRKFEEEGPRARSASEWADELGTEPDYIYQLRSEFRDDVEDDRDDAAESPGPPDGDDEGQTDTGESPSPSEAPSQPPADAGAQGPADAGTSTDGGTHGVSEGSGPESIDVGHDGQEKLSPKGWDDEAVSSIDPPEGVDVDGFGPDDFEPEPAVTPTPDSPPTKSDPDPDPEPSDASDSSGLLGRIRGDSDTERSTDEIVEDADSPAERDRRQELLEQLDDAGGPTVPPEAQEADEGPTPAEAQPRLVVNQELVESLFRMPFSQAAQATGWDGWELSDAEAQANAELFVAWCRENDVDLSTGTMLAMSLVSTVGGRAAGYVRYRRTSDTGPQPDPDDAPDSDADTADAQAPDRPDESTGDDVGFDFNDPETW